MGADPTSVERFRRALARDPLDIRSRLQLAEALRASGLGDEARAELAMVARLCGPSHAEALSWLRDLQPLARRSIPVAARIAHPLAPGEEAVLDDDEAMEVSDADIVSVVTLREAAATATRALARRPAQPV